MKKAKPEITAEQLKALQVELKDLNMQWVPLLVKQMKADKTIEKQFQKVNGRKVYNVFNGIVKNGAWKIVIFKQANILKTALLNELTEAVS